MTKESTKYFDIRRSPFSELATFRWLQTSPVRIAYENTLVMYSTGNGAEKCVWPDGGAAPFRGETVHLDGYNVTDALAGKTPSPRKEFFYFGDRGNPAAVRVGHYKVVFAWVRTALTFITAGLVIDKGAAALHEARVLAGTNWVSGSHAFGVTLTAASTVSVDHFGIVPRHTRTLSQLMGIGPTWLLLVLDLSCVQWIGRFSAHTK